MLQFIEMNHIRDDCFYYCFNKSFKSNSLYCITPLTQSKACTVGWLFEFWDRWFESRIFKYSARSSVSGEHYAAPPLPPCSSVDRVFLGNRQPAWPGVIVGTHCCNSGNRDHCWLATVASVHITATMTLDIIVTFDIIVVVVISYE
jgi:hypothetical protein